MKSIDKKLSIFLVLMIILTMISACNSSTYAESDTIIISADSLSDYIGADNVVIVDMQSANDYAARHVEGAVNITKSEIVTGDGNMLPDEATIETLLGSNGISNDTTVIVYDSDNMTASRMVWTLFMYGHQNVLLVDGGIKAIKNTEGITLTTEKTTPVATTFDAVYDDEWIADYQDVLNQVNDPDENTILLDVRTDEEYAESGKVPSSVMVDYTTNFYSDGTFKDTQTTKINYLDDGIYPENEVIMYCQTSMRAAAVFVRLYDAGYRNLKVYDGAYLEWSSNPDSPIDMPSTDSDTVTDTEDAS
jgi:thiosulfate/3-mercaptopyruvate sulfurtransferase